MSTLAPAEVVWYARARVAQRPGAVFSGIVGDKAHRAGGGYHISIEDQPSTNYSVTRPDDKAPPGGWPRNMASAVDRSQPKAQMIDAWNKMYAVWVNRANDPRAKYINAYNGWNGKGEPERLDFVTGKRSVTDRSHWTHDHEERRRRYVNSREASLALLSIDRGESIAQYLGQPETPTGSREMMGILAVCKPVHGDSVFFGDGNFHRPIYQMADANDLAAAGAVWKNYTTEERMFQAIGPVPLASVMAPAIDMTGLAVKMVEAVNEKLPDMVSGALTNAVRAAAPELADAVADEQAARGSKDAPNKTPE